MFLHKKILGGDFIKIEKWNGFDIRFNDKGEIITEDFMAILSLLSDGMYLPISILEEQSYYEVFGIYFLEDGRQLKVTLWVEDEMLDTESPIVLVDIKKAYGYEMPIPPRHTPIEIASQEYIYVIGMAGTKFYKIGCSNNPVERLKALQTANPCDLDIIAIFISQNMYLDERRIHEHLNRFHKRGEWFEIDNVFETVMAVKDKYGLDVSVSDTIYKKTEEKVG